MNYYFLPGTGIFGGIKDGFHLAEALCLGGASCCVATPDGKSANWFSSRAGVVSHKQALDDLGENGKILFSYPYEYEMLKATGARLYFHCQGTDPLIDPLLQDDTLCLLHSWPQAKRYMKDKTGRDSIDVGLMIPDCFFYDGQTKCEGTVAYMPRRGNNIAAACMEACPELSFVAIDGANEREVAHLMKSCECYLATSVGEWFGLPALEAMAAGCVVLSVPVVGGTDYFEHGVNGMMSDPEKIPETLSGLMSVEQRGIRQSLRDHAIATASRYRESIFRRHVMDQLAGPLRELCE